jgi:hypothetical protein
MKTRFRSEDDGWTAGGRKITAPEFLETIRVCLEDQGPVIVEHWFYRGSCSPDRLVFSNIDTFVEYLDTHASAGDAIHVWSFASGRRDDNELASGKCPDEWGLIPKRKPIPIKLSPETQRRLKLLFRQRNQAEAEELLVQECGNNLPGSEKSDEYDLERVRFAAMKVSNGNLNKLYEAVGLAQEDWRDLLVNAGFANDVNEHKKWLA